MTYWRDYEKDGVPEFPALSAADVTALVLCDLSRNLNYTLEGLWAQSCQGFDLRFYDTYDHTSPSEAAEVLAVARTITTPLTLVMMAGTALYPGALAALLDALEKGEGAWPGERYVNRVENLETAAWYDTGTGGELDDGSASVLPRTLLLPTALLVQLLEGLHSQSLYHVITDVYLRAVEAGHTLAEAPWPLAELSADQLVLGFRETPMPFDAAPDADMAFVLLASDARRTARLAARLHRAHPGASLYVMVPVSLRLGRVPAGTVRYELPDEGLVAGLEAVLPDIGRKAVVVLQDSIAHWEPGAFGRLAGCAAVEGMAAASPFLYDGDNKVLYAGATTAGASLYKALFRQHGVGYARAINIVNVVREIGVLNEECFCLAGEALAGLLPLTPGITSLREWVVELSLRVRAEGLRNLYCGKVRLQSVWSEATTGNGSWGTATGGGICRWLEQYPELVSNDATLPFGITRGDTHLGPSVCITQPGRMLGAAAKGRVLAVSHEMTLTGAPLVLVKAMRVLREAGYEVVCVAPKAGPVQDELKKEGISVIIDPLMLYGVKWQDVGPGFNLVLPNTILPYQVAGQLSGTGVPVLWWIHDAEAGYAYYDGLLPADIGPNVHTYCTGGHALAVLQRYRPSYHPQNLFYGMEDLTLEPPGEYDLSPWAGRVIFATVGSMEHRKGPDILAEAVGLLPDEVRRRCAFLFVGRPYEADMVAAVRRAEARYPEVKYIENIPRSNIPAFFKGLDCVVCSSRDDPLPVFITEGMMFSKVTICSEHTGTALIVENGVNGYVYGEDSPQKLADCICEVAENLEGMDELRRRSRATYERWFTMEVFRRNLLSLVEQLCQNPTARAVPPED